MKKRFRPPPAGDAGQPRWRTRLGTPVFRPARGPQARRRRTAALKTGVPGADAPRRIPPEFELTAEEVVILREEDRLVIKPVTRSPSLREVLAGLSPLDGDFGPLDDPPVRPEKIL